MSLPHTEYGIAAYYIIAPCEASSNLARYDGIHFGHRTKEPVTDIIDLVSKSRAEAFGPEVQRRIMIGTYASVTATTTPSTCALSRFAL